MATFQINTDAEQDATLAREATAQGVSAAQLVTLGVQLAIARYHNSHAVEDQQVVADDYNRQDSAEQARRVDAAKPV